MRKAVYNGIDFLKGSPVNSHLKEIRSLMNEVSMDSLLNKNRPKLYALLDRVASETSFYKHLKGYESLQDFPVVNKNIIREHFEDINLPLPESQKITVKTSGSTGTPFKIYQSKSKKQRNTADTIYFAQRSGFEIGYRLLYLRFWAAYYKKPNWLAYLQNIDQLEVEELTDDFLEGFLKNIYKDRAPKGWLGYASGYDKIIRYLERINSEVIDANIKSIISMSEPLPESIQEKMSYYFNCPTVSRYSNVENGIIAQQEPGEKYFKINWASYFVELHKLNEDIPAEIGEAGRIVITDIYNVATPLIRYDTGDVGVFQLIENDLPVFQRIEGRKTDLLTNTEGKLVNPFVLYNSLGDYPELQQVQLIQKNKNYIFRINPVGETFEREREFLNYYKPFLGPGANVTVEYVNEIPTLKSGKRKLIVNLSS